MPGDGGAFDAGSVNQCSVDSDCKDGVNGRCVEGGRGFEEFQCSYDECSTAVACASGNICICGTAGGLAGRSGNVCLPSNCTSDSDCGTGGYCSPTYDTMCGPYDGTVGYFCHRLSDECSKDECVNDSDCTGSGTEGSPGEAGYCAWDGASSKWTCAFTFCAG